MRISDWSSDVCSSDLAEAQRCRKRSVEDGERTRCAAEQDRLGQGAMDGREESADRRVRIEVRHQTSAPPPNEKNDRKKELAANAIDRPNTIWMRSEEHTSELQSLMRRSYAVFCLKKKNNQRQVNRGDTNTRA